MKRMTSREIRDMWLKYFNERGHLIVPSANLIPKDDDTLLWINAGVTPLKRYFDGSEVPVSKRITNIQKCIRTNDIENVGVTRRHHTFFEMMGNFSIGDYFKEEAIEFAYNLLTGKEWFDIPTDKLYVTVFPDDIDTIIDDLYPVEDEEMDESCAKRIKKAYTDNKKAIDKLSEASMLMRGNPKYKDIRESIKLLKSELILRK